jgi:hypothetical protein
MRPQKTPSSGPEYLGKCVLCKLSMKALLSIAIVTRDPPASGCRRVDRDSLSLNLASQVVCLVSHSIKFRRTCR